jgi:hypothetical protein
MQVEELRDLVIQTLEDMKAFDIETSMSAARPASRITS